MNFRVRTHEQERTSVRICAENYPRLSKDELDGLEKRFKKQDKKNVGHVTQDDLFEILRKVGHFISDSMSKRIKNELTMRELNNIDLLTLLDLVNEIKGWVEEEEFDLESEYVDAFVALGGKADKTGTVKKEAIVDLIQGEFELTYNVEELIESFGIEGEELDFQAFCLFCEGAGGDKMNKNKNSLAMVAGTKTPRNLNSNGSFVAKFEDFERFVASDHKRHRMFF